MDEETETQRAEIACSGHSAAEWQSWDSNPSVAWGGSALKPGTQHLRGMSHTCSHPTGFRSHPCTRGLMTPQTGRFLDLVCQLVSVIHGHWRPPKKPTTKQNKTEKHPTWHLRYDFFVIIYLSFVDLEGMDICPRDPLRLVTSAPGI